MALNGTHCAETCCTFLFTDVKWKTFGVFVRILLGVFGSTHKYFCVLSVCLVCLKRFVASEYTALGVNFTEIGQN